MRFRIGSRNAAVLPVPVSAQPIRSLPSMTIGMTALWIGVVRVEAANPDALDERMLEAEGFEGDRPRIVIGLRAHDGGVGWTGRGFDDAPGRGAPPRAAGRRRCRPGLFDCVVWEFKRDYLASAEGDDAADRIVWGNADGDAVAGHYLDAEAAHPAAQLCKHLVALITLHAIQAAAVHRHDGALHINQIILAQAIAESFPIKDCAIFAVARKLSRQPPGSRYALG